MKIILVDDNQTFRLNLRFFLENKLHHTIIAEAGSGEEFLGLTNITSANVVLMDIIMGYLDGMATTKKILWVHPQLKVIALTMHIEKVFLTQLIEAGFRGCVFKTDIFNTLEIALLEVDKGEVFYPGNLKFDQIQL